jgi:intracellular sulfur oxidation DsrE/DsrF family protein
VRRIAIALTLGWALASPLAPAAGWCGGEPDDRRALAGLSRARAVFDLRAGNAESLVFGLELVGTTFEGLERQKVTPSFVVEFRGPGVRLLTRDPANAEVAALLAGLRRRGVGLEVCSLALRAFQVDAGALVPDVVPVGNGLNSLIGYQEKGYALVPLY